MTISTHTGAMMNDSPTIINLGCGFNKLIGAINVDAFEICNPDVVWDLNKFPYPFENNSVDQIIARHVFEHLDDWWGALGECARILKNGGRMHIGVPDESSMSAITYRDHKHIFSLLSFHGIINYTSGSNAWAKTVETALPLKMIEYRRVPFKEYEWMIKWCPWLLSFCAKHLRNFIWEQRFEFQKQIPIGGKNE